MKIAAITLLLAVSTAALSAQAALTEWQGYRLSILYPKEWFRIGSEHCLDILSDKRRVEAVAIDHNEGEIVACPAFDNQTVEEAIRINTGDDKVLSQKNIQELEKPNSTCDRVIEIRSRDNKSFQNHVYKDYTHYFCAVGRSVFVVTQQNWGHDPNSEMYQRVARSLVRSARFRP